VAYQRDDYFTVRMGLELDVGAQRFLEIDVVVDFSIHRENDRAIVTEQWLCSGV
jgi:hypothetical protein